MRSATRESAVWARAGANAITTLAMHAIVASVPGGVMDASPPLGRSSCSAAALTSIGCCKKPGRADRPGIERADTRPLLLPGQFLERERVADVRKRLVAGEAFGLVHAGLVFLVRGEDRVVPVLVADQLGNILAPSGVARHGRIAQQLVRLVEAVGARARV